MSLSLVVMAAGMSTRYGRLKQLDGLGPGGEAIMDYNVFDAMRVGFGSVTYIVRREILGDVRAHVERVFGDTIRASFVCQELDHLPEGFRAPPERVKPWGTAHAVLTAAEQVQTPFAVCNSDDLYGPGAFGLLHDELSRPTPDADAVMVGYQLDHTLSGSGGVARGVCVLSAGQRLERMTEVQNIRVRDGWITGTTTDGTPVELTGQEVVSMNLWGFTAPVVERLRRQFREFLEYWGADPQQECFLSSSISHQIELGVTSVKVLQAPDTWFGVTHAAERERSIAILRERVGSGAYPDRMADALARMGRAGG